MSLISPGGENLLDYLELGQRPLQLQQGPQGPALVASGKPSLHARCEGSSGESSPVDAGGLRPCGELGPEPEDSSPVLTWMWGCFWSLHRGVSPRLKWGHARPLSSVAVASVSHFPSRGSRILWPSLQAFPRDVPTGLSHVPPRCESILGVKVEAVQGKEVPLEWTETFVGLLEWWHEPGVAQVFPVKSASS